MYLCLGTDEEHKLGLGNFDARYANKTDSKYEMKVPERILVVGESMFV